MPPIDIKFTGLPAMNDAVVLTPQTQPIDILKIYWNVQASTMGNAMFPRVPHNC